MADDRRRRLRRLLDRLEQAAQQRAGGPASEEGIPADDLLLLTRQAVEAQVGQLQTLRQKSTQITSELGLRDEQIRVLEAELFHREGEAEAVQATLQERQRWLNQHQSALQRRREALRRLRSLRDELAQGSEPDAEERALQRRLDRLEQAAALIASHGGRQGVVELIERVRAIQDRLVSQSRRLLSMPHYRACLELRGEGGRSVGAQRNAGGEEPGDARARIAEHLEGLARSTGQLRLQLGPAEAQVTGRQAELTGREQAKRWLEGERVAEEVWRRVAVGQLERQRQRALQQLDRLQSVHRRVLRAESELSGRREAAAWRTGHAEAAAIWRALAERHSRDEQRR